MHFLWQNDMAQIGAKGLNSFGYGYNKNSKHGQK
jgi:hypothetical protein